MESLTAALSRIGFESTCIATSTTEEPSLEDSGVNAVWAIASALGETEGLLWLDVMILFGEK